MSTRYDAFISYRRTEPDRTHARMIRRELMNRGYKVAIDEVDFDGNKPFLIEMDRCIDESRFMLSIITPNFLKSGNVEEEQIMAIVRDMAARERRLIPLTFEKVTLPRWLYILSGIDFTEPDPLEPPLEKLLRNIGPPLNP